jgi:hypothetical protein
MRISLPVQLSWALFIATSVAAGLGLLMIALKDLVLIHLH